MIKKVLFSGTALAAALLLASCSTGGGTAADDSGSTEAGGAGKEICYITAAESHAYATPANKAFQEAADAAGAKVTMLSQDFDVQTGTEQLTTCIGRNPDGIVLWPLDPQAYIPGLIQAQAAQIPVVLINTPMDDEALKLVASFTGPDVYEEGKLSAEAMTEALGGSGKVVIIAGQAGNGTTIGRTDGFTDELKAAGADIEVLQTVNADFDQQKALVASRDLITRFGDDIGGVYANDDTMARGFIDAWAEAGKDPKAIPPIIGINGQKDAFESIKAGQFYATIVQSPVEDGKLALDTILKAAAGEQVESRLPIPLTVVTAENVDSEEPAF
ncbi:monosaccharide ABC transporter substrate-binding protein (CUT2 family) [Leucobacter luti]|uniref:sugar ABC transporter substrate-binding protein n=1 Tax=Leucobacter luti TaxID=340320 RepID=UPI00104C482F|nr:sugar ABC transporter substrate-binding protein [Leucobacter luti]MCW2289205.1 ABC-type sugar transport system substrate-binding protein [Leucobacter luti]TCK39768.1 monosaccharide ABC transporter substrate-binding protein (CUT2 family) [Leucobacter luti]